MACAIVALPDDQEPVWKLSSEKIPHMTLLFLGDVTENQLDIAEFVGQVANTATPFGLSVKNRGPLGPDDADVLFFQKNSWSIRGLEEIRRFLLTETHIFTAYNSVEQYPEWTPHLTMGYPGKPAKKDDADYNRLSYVHFNRLAVWFGDFEGPTFDLEYSESGEVGEMSMNAPLGLFLEHHGVKGMKWGVRKDRGHEGERATNKKIAKLDKKFEKGSMAQYWKVHNAMAERLNNGELDKLNNDPRFKNKDMSDPYSPLTSKYAQEVNKLAVRVMNEESAKVLGTNASGTKKWAFEYDVSIGMPTGRLVDVNEKVKHSMEDGIILKFKWDNLKHLVGVEVVKDSVEHREISESFLEHFGVKGMKWGIIRTKAEIAEGVVEVSQRTAGTKLTAAGGKGFEAHDDAKKTAASRQIAKKSTTDALSTKDLQELVNRMNLEQQYSKLTASQASPGQKFVNKLLVDTAQNVARSQAQNLVKDIAGKHGVKM